MITYLKGIPVAVSKSMNNKLLLTLEVQDIAYEIQVTPRLAQQINLPATTPVQIFTHYQIRDEQAILYGFSTNAERDLFRQLIAVAGIGTQLAIALINTLSLEDLVQAIITNNTKLLCQTPGVGEKTAARIALELKTKLKQWYKSLGIEPRDSRITTPPDMVEDLEITLLTLGYTASEIEQAIAALAQDTQLQANSEVEVWLKRAIAYLTPS